ncbi:MAG: hypothetical protein EBZ28_00510 [Alphaproteobacteria bacterium]|jgi:hypothetical protein|nr:hypothetical protein [Alphaproteobacteria bacterium]
MKAKIYKPSKTSMQSGLGRTKKWILEFQKEKNKFKESLMGWIGSSDTSEQVRLYFESVEDAINFANKNKIEYNLVSETKKKYSAKSYSDNFKFDRKDKWTH